MRLTVALARFIALVLFLPAGLATIVHAQGGDPTPGVLPIVLTDEQQEYFLPSHIEILRDPGGKLTIHDISSPAYEDQFLPNAQMVPNLGMTRDAVWVRLRVRNDSIRKDWLLGLTDARVGEIAFYQPSGEPGNFVEKLAGRDYPFSARDVPHRDYFFRLELPAGSEQTLYLRLQSNRTALIFPLTISTAEALALKDQKDLLFLGLFYGAMLIMAGYNLFIYFSLKETSYLFLVLFIVFYSLSSSARDGLAAQYLWPSEPAPFFVPSLLMLAMIFQVKFTAGVLDTRRLVPRLHLLLNSLVIGCLLVSGISLFISAGIVINLLIAVTLVVDGLAAFRVWHQGYRAARFYLASWAFLLVAGTGFVFSSLNLLFGYTIPETVVKAAMAVGTLFGSLALADRVQLLKAQTEAANRQLERSERKYRSLFENSLDAIFISTRTGQFVDLNPAGIELFGYDESEVKKINVQEVYAMQSEREKTIHAIEARGFLKDYPIRMRRKDGSEIETLVTSNLWLEEGSSEAGYQGIVRDVTERRRIEAELEQHRHHLEELVQVRTEQVAAELAERQRTQGVLQKRLQQLSSLNEMAKTVSAVTDLRQTLEFLTDSMNDLFGASSIFITLLDRGSSQVRLLAAYTGSLQSDPSAGHPFNLDGLPGFRQVADQQLPLVILDPQNSPLLVGIRDLLRIVESQAILLVPLRVHNDVIGVMAVNTRQAGLRFDQEEITLAETVAGLIATALQNERLFQEAQILAVEKERHRLARDLHDSVIQTLYSTVLLASGWRMLAEQGRLDNGSVAEHFQQVARQSEQALKEMRLLLFQLRPPDLEEVGLASAIQQRLDAVERRVSIETSLLTTGEPIVLPTAVGQELYNILQEALNNALRHAEATAIAVKLDYRGGCVDLAVEDNGLGFEPGATPGGMGLQNMQERAREIGAVLSITSIPQQGTRVHVVWELPQNGHAY